MGDWPTSGTRGASSSRGSGGYPSGGSSTAAMAAAGFLSPAAARALADVGKAVPLPTAPLSQLPSNAVARSAMAGLARGLLPRAGALGLAAWGAYELWSWWNRTAGAEGGLVIPAGWTKTSDCGGTADRWTSDSSYGGDAYCARTNWYLTPNSVNGPPLKSTTRTIATGQFTGHPPSVPTYETWKPVAQYSRPAGSTAPAPYFEDPKVGTPLPNPARPAQPDEEAPPWVPTRHWDPLSNPVGAPPPPARTLPYRWLPQRVLNPNRSPVEQPQRGNTVPVAPWGPLLPGQEGYPGWKPAPGRVTPAPGAPAPDEVDWPPFEWPGKAPVPAPPLQPGELPGEDLPGWVADPVPTAPGQTPGTEAPGATDPATVTPPVDPIRTEDPAGSAGPTIIIGGGPPVGPHLRAPPGPRTKERKSRYVRTGHTLAIKKLVNPLTEGLDALDCFYKALPRSTRWNVQKADWAQQRAEARAAGVKLTKTPKGFADFSDAPKVSLENPGIAGTGVFGMHGQSVSLPGAVNFQGNRYADLNAHHLQPLSPQDKANAVWRFADQLDLNAAIECMVADQIEDAVIGRQSGWVDKAARKNRRVHGYETGSLF